MNSYHGERIDCVKAYKSLYITSTDDILIHKIKKAFLININGLIYETNYIQSKHVRKNPPLAGNKNFIVLRRGTFFTQTTPISEPVRSYFLSYFYTNGPIGSTLSGDLMDRSS